MKIIIHDVLTEIILNFDANTAFVFCSKTIQPKSRIVNYADLTPEQFSISESIISDFRGESVENLIQNFSLNDLLSRISRKIKEHYKSVS